MNKGIVICLLATSILASVHLTEAQQAKKVPRIGVAGTDDTKGSGPLVEAFRQGLRDLGYIEGKSILLEYRFPAPGGGRGQYSRLVAELVQLKVDVLVAVNFPAIQEAKEATNTIPIVMRATADPVAAGIVNSLARPGGNITGIATLQRDLSGKRLELLNEVVPGILRVGVLRSADTQVAAISFKEYETAARALKIRLRSLEVRDPNPDLDGAFQAAAKERASALIVITDTRINRYAKRIADLAMRNRTPSMCERSDYVEAGCLMSYATNDADAFGRLATYVDKILKGAKPADLPIEQPTKFELWINLKTAKQLGLTIPQSVLYRADKVIR